MTLLDDILTASTDAGVATPDLLRKVQIVARRLGATEVENWVRDELGGYPDGAAVPAYRVQNTNVTGVYAGPFRSFMKHPLTVVPRGMAEWWRVTLREPIIEIQSLTEGDQDPERPWPSNVVQQYEESGVFQMEHHGLFSASNVLTTSSLRGVVDAVRSKAMEFALDLQAQFPDAGAVGGPTVNDPDVAKVVYNITNNITGNGTNIAAGENVRQRSTVTQGDEAALRAEAAALGLPPERVDEFVAALRDERSVDGPRTSGLIARVGAGAINLSGNIAANLAATGLIALGRAFLGL
ncbi:hypothetical protein ACIRCZ_11485 [Leifsonia sp. NPDC102414]|uniref:AbiTii domain-containing protein n=1 Tax=Leifsonia sp. NPDC102414 TaxID=3364124 RepID=UPI00382CBAB0